MHLTEVILQAARKKTRKQGVLPLPHAQALTPQSLAGLKNKQGAAEKTVDKEGPALMLPATPLPVLSIRSDYAVFRSGNRATFVPGIISKQQ